jgi:phage I-like protein
MSKQFIHGHQPFELAADGWSQIAPLGEFFHGADVIQILDAEACLSMVARFDAEAESPTFAGLLVDFDHLSLDPSARSEAAGWITSLAFRAEPVASAGLYAAIRWTDEGQAAMTGGRYRFVSPVWLREDCVDLGTDAQGRQRLRPVRLFNLAVTNNPNLQGLAPLSNAGKNEEADKMKQVIEWLQNRQWVQAGADEAQAMAAMADLPTPEQWRNIQAALANARTEVEAAKVELANARATQADRELAEFAGLVDKSWEFWKQQLLQNREATLAVLRDLVALRTGAKPELPVVAPVVAPLHNRQTVSPAVAGQTESAAVRIRNRAQEISKAEGIPFSAAFRRAEAEIVA